MVKRGGTKRKAEIKKITDKNSKATTFTKRRDGLFSKASQLCLLGDAQIAVLATLSSSNSNVSFFSFGHSSVDSVVSAYLSGQRPAPVPVLEESKEMREDIGICMARKDLGLGYWWDDEKLARSKDPQEIMQAIESIKILQRDAKRLLEDEAIEFDQRESSLVVHEKNQNMSKSEVDQTLIDVDDLLPQTLVTTEDDQIMFVCDSFCNKDKNAALSHAEEKFEEWSDMDFEQLLNGFDSDKKTEDDDHQIVEDDQIMSVSDSFCNNYKNTAHAEESSEEWTDMDFEQILNGFDDSHDEKSEEKDDDHQIEAVSENSCNNQNLLDLDLATVDYDTIFEGLAYLDGEFVAPFLM